MENIHIEDIRYKKILKGGSIDIAQGEFVLICGRTGSGKTTLLKLLKEKAGTDAGYVMQNPDNQIVCDKVYTELEFAASAGNASRDYVRTRIAETAAYFGISGMLDKEVDKLSGGEKQILNIACAMAANPKILILDEACSMLDPIMSDRVADLLCNINREYGITVIMAEHRTDRVFANADKVVFINDGFVQSGPMRQMAHDMCRNPQEALEQIIELGCHRILTSGQEATAEKGIPLLKELVELADERIIIMPGCGVNPKNIRKIAEETGACEFHFSGRTTCESDMLYRNPKVSMGGTVKIEEYKKDVTDPDIVKAALAELALKDENDKALEKKTKESKKLKRVKRDDEWDDEDDDLEDDK